MFKLRRLHNRFFNKNLEKIFVKNINIFLQKKIIRDFFVYSFGSMFLKGVSFFLIPLYTSILTPAQYGQIELLNNASTILLVFLTLGLVPVFSVEYFQCKKYSEKIKLLNQIIALYIVISTPAYLISLFLIMEFFSLVFGTGISKFIIIIVLITSYLTFFQSLFFGLLQYTKRAIVLTINKIAIGLLIGLLNIYLIYYLRLDVFGYFLTNLIVMFLSVSYAGYEYFIKIKHVKIEIDFKVYKKYLSIAFPFIIGSVSFWLLSGIDRWMVLKYLGDREVGIYSIAAKFATLYDALLITPMLLVYGPYIYERFAQGKYEQKIKQITLLTLLVFFLLAILTPLIARLLINKNFDESLKYISYLVIGYAFYFLSQIAGQLIIFHKKRLIMVVNVLLSSILNILSNIILIPQFHLLGTVYAFVLSYFFWFVLSWYQTHSLKKKFI